MAHCKENVLAHPPSDAAELLGRNILRLSRDEGHIVWFSNSSCYFPCLLFIIVNWYIVRGEETHSHSLSLSLSPSKLAADDSLERGGREGNETWTRLWTRLAANRAGFQLRGPCGNEITRATPSFSRFARPWRKYMYLNGANSKSVYKYISEIDRNWSRRTITTFLENFHFASFVIHIQLCTTRPISPRSLDENGKLPLASISRQYKFSFVFFEWLRMTLDAPHSATLVAWHATCATAKLLANQTMN